ncbi:DUF4429 domain-containing protein [Kribbella sp. HUAS MG21]|uniref:DUF4429 domain-containing protein n=1 Tax=Kribbella sp. HUAS MG21 TaxID=3160966 RepID=A0AAU7TNN5_9ACTN
MTGGELAGTNGTVVWDGIGTLRVRYDGPRDGLDRLTSSLRTRLGERILPVEALAAAEVDGPVLRLRLRDGADPLQSVSGGYFDSLISPYCFPCTEPDVAERIAGEIRRTLARRDVPRAPATRWLVAPPVAPDRLEGRDATLSVEQGELRFAYARTAGRRKRAFGDPWALPLDEITDVEWTPHQGRLGVKGFLRVSTARSPQDRPKPKHDPAALRVDRRTDVDALFFAARLLTRIRP